MMLTLARVPRIRCFLCFTFLIFGRVVQASPDNDDSLLDNEQSALSRKMASLGSRSTQPSQPRVARSSYPETNDPHICLAFLSCCDRTDLLNHTLAGVLRHMEEDEPSFLRYEIAWVDNGSDPEKTAEIADSYQIEHALTLPENMGLAYGMNLLISNLCTAPYILLLEEDWLYLDELIAPQTPERKRAIATSVALIENLAHNNLTAYDGRNVMGVFLRHESYETFLTFPHADVWETREQVDIPKELPSLKQPTEQCKDSSSEDSSLIADVDYRIFCGDTGIQRETIWGSYTNGAGLYKRADLMAIGRMYGEPGDAFHDRYVEGNYAYRAALQNCHAALRLTDDRDCTQIHHPNCAGAFHHIGGGRGTRPMTAQGTTCDDTAWNFFGTPMYEKYHKSVELTTGKAVERCSKEQLQQLRARKFRDTDAEEYRDQVKKSNQEVFEKEGAEREKLRQQANTILQMLLVDPEKLKLSVPWMAEKSTAEIREMAHRLHRLADSPHPMNGFWDSHGRIHEKKTAS